MEDRVGMLAKLFEEESIPELQGAPEITPYYGGTNQSINIWKPARIRIVNVKPMKVVTRTQVKKDLLRYSLEERAKIVLATLKSVQVGPQSPATIAKWRKDMIENPEKLHPEVLKAVAIQLRTTKWQQKLKKQSSTPARMGGITMLTTGDADGPGNMRAPAIVNQLVIKGTRPRNKGSPAEPPPKDQPRQTVARIRAMSTGNPEQGRRIASKYLELVQAVKADHPDHSHTTEQQERMNLQKLVVKALKRQTKSVPGLGQKLVEQYKLKQQQLGIKQGHIPTEPFRANSPPNMATEDDPLDKESKDKLYTNLPAETTPEALYIPMHVQVRYGTHVIPALLDTGATRNILSRATANKMGLNWTTEETPVQATNVDGSCCGSGIINQYCDIPMKLDDLWKTERFHLAEIGTDQAILGMPWLENFNPTINWTKGTIQEVLEVPLHQKNKGGKKCTWKEGLIKEPAVTNIPQSKEDTDNTLIAELQEKKLKSKEGLEQELLNDYLEDLLCVEETQSRDPQERTATEKDQQHTPWSGDHCPILGIRPGGEQDEVQKDLAKLATISPVKGENNDLWELTMQSQIIKPELDGSNNLEADEQKPPISHKGTDPMRREMYKALGIVDIPQRPDTSKRIPIQQRMPEDFRKAAKLLKSLKSAAAKAQERHKKGIKMSRDNKNGTSKTTEEHSTPLPGLENLEQLNDAELTSSPVSMILEDHGLGSDRNAQRHAEIAEKRADQSRQREVKHDLLDPSTQEDEHLDQKEGQGPEHMVVEDHEPKKGMAPRLKPQIKPLFFPFATCLPDVSALPDSYDGTIHKQSIAKKEPTRWELESPWPDQWQSEGLAGLTTTHEDLEPDRTKFQNDSLNWKEPDNTICAPNAISWETIKELYWTPELDNAAEPESEENPYPQTLHLLDESTLEREPSPQLTNDETQQWKEIRSLQLKDKRELQNSYQKTYRNNTIKALKATSDDEEGSTITNELTNQESDRPNKRKTRHAEQMQPWKTLTQQWNDTKQRDSNESPMLQTSAHYSETGKTINQPTTYRSIGTQSGSLIQEPDDQAMASLSPPGGAGTDHANASRSINQNNPGIVRHSKTPPDHNARLTALTIWSLMVATMLRKVLTQPQITNSTSTDQGDTLMTKTTLTKEQEMIPGPKRTDDRHVEEVRYKSSARSTTNSPFQTLNIDSTPSTPDNPPVNLPCRPPSLTPLLRLRSEDSGSKDKWTTIPGKATTSSIPGGVTTTAPTPGTVTKQWKTTKITIEIKMPKVTRPGTPVRHREAKKAKLPTTLAYQTTLATAQMTKPTKNGQTSPHLGTSLPAKNTPNLTTSSRMSYASDSPITPRSECWGNASPPMISPDSANISAWMGQHNDSREKYKPSTSTTRTWKNSFTVWTGTCAQKASSTHSTKAAASPSLTHHYTNKEPKSLGPYPANGHDDANDSGRQQRPSTSASVKKPPRCTYSSFRTTGSPLLPCTTYSASSISRDPRTHFGGKCFSKTSNYTTRSSESKDTLVQPLDSMPEAWNLPPKKGMNVASPAHFSILSTPTQTDHLTAYLTDHLIRAPDLGAT